MEKKDLIATRAILPSDRGLIFSTWLKGLRYANDWFKHIDQDAYFHHYQQVLESYFNRPDINCSVACLREDPDVILGYAVYEPHVLHWVFVKPAWRRIGIAKMLVPPGIKTVSHLTHIGLLLKKDRIFNPFI